MGKLFGTDGARGVAGKDLTPELAMQIGRAAAGGTVLFGILLVLTICYFFALNKRVHYLN